MKKKHNKRANTLFLYEVLVRKTINFSFNNQKEEGRDCFKILKAFFHPFAELSKEIGILRSVSESKGLERGLSEKILEESKRSYSLLNKKKIEKEKSELTQILQKKFGKDIFNIFVPNYKNIATIYQIMNRGSNIKNNVLLEQNILESMQKSDDVKKTISSDKLIIKTFSERFNQEYSDKLNEPQKTLLKEYVLSFSDNGLSLKTFLNDEVETSKQILYEYRKTLRAKNVGETEEGFENLGQVLTLLENFQKEEVNKEMVHKMLKIQQLVEEIKEIGNK